MNDSTAPGYLLPESSTALDDAALDAVLQALVVGITGLPGGMVRPRWQATTPIMPEVTVNWCAIGVTDLDPDANAAMVHQQAADDGEGADQSQRHDSLTITASFYGPNAMGNARLMRDGLWVGQNRDTLAASSLGLTGVAGPINATTLLNQKWQRRFDLTITMKQLTLRTYPVRNIIGVQGTITTDTTATPTPFTAESNE
jgi:hypothetical protein